MAVKKNELYASLWASCDQLRGGMDSSQYKDYILTLLFMKYVTDKYKGAGKYADLTVFDKAHDPEPDPEKRVGCSFDDMVALKGNKNIGEGINKIIARLANLEENIILKGVIENANFNDEEKLGKGKEMVDKLTNLIGIFERPEFDFKNNKASGDDILGDAYEYLMRKFATESGKSKGQFYTPAEVSRILAKVVGIDKIKPRSEGWTLCDPACGSGSLLIRAVNEAPENLTVSVWGQEKETTTAGLAKMNLVLHNKADGEIRADNTFSNPYMDENDKETIKRFDFIVANPPFSLKNWTNGMVNYDRFNGYGAEPPTRNGDFAWLLHIIKALKSTGKAAVILPHGVLFRGNAEDTIRRAIIDRGYIKAVIGLPSNLFYGTGIPACIIILDKEDADERNGIFLIDASKGYVKDGNKNRLREQDIKKIIDTYENQIEEEHYSRFVFNKEIKKDNDYNLNIPRYIDNSDEEDIQDIDAHLKGGIPMRDIDSIKYWQVFSSLKDKLFSKLRDGYYKLNIDKDDVRDTIYNDEEFSNYADKIDSAFSDWMEKVDSKLKNIDSNIDVKQFIVELSNILINCFNDLELIDKYDVYEVLLEYWQEVMSDDVFLIKYDGYLAGREIDYTYKTKKKKVDGKEIEVLTDTVKSWEGKLIPRNIVEKVYFSKERLAIDKAQQTADTTQQIFDDLIEENTGEDGILADYLNDKGNIDSKSITKINKHITELKKSKNTDDEEYLFLTNFVDVNKTLKAQNKIVNELNKELDTKELAKYSELSVDEIKNLIVNEKWNYSIFEGIKEIYSAISNDLASRITLLTDRYENTLPYIEKQTACYEGKVKAFLKDIGFNW